MYDWKNDIELRKIYLNRDVLQERPVSLSDKRVYFNRED